MPKFVFIVGDHSAEYDLASVAEAKCEAVRYAGELICDSAETFWDSNDFEMVVTDEKGLALFALHMIGTESPAMRSIG